MAIGWIFLILLSERLFELCLARRHTRALLARGGREFSAETYPYIVALHSCFLIALFLESYPWQVPGDAITFITLSLFLLLQGGRYWCIISLGEQWNTRIILVPAAPVIKRGPYRWLRHPNYLIVTLEFLLLPLLLRAPLTFFLFFPINLLLLRQRIRLEEAALCQFSDYSSRFLSR
jgi:methyltransferase